MTRSTSHRAPPYLLADTLTNLRQIVILPRRARYVGDGRLRLVFFPPGPLHHGAPLFSAMLAHRHGGTVILAEHFDAEETLRIIERYRVTFIQ